MCNSVNAKKKKKRERERTFMRKHDTRKTNKKAEIILVEVSWIVCMNIGFQLTIVISLINKKD